MFLPLLAVAIDAITIMFPHFTFKPDPFSHLIRWNVSSLTVANHALPDLMCCDLQTWIAAVQWVVPVKLQHSVSFFLLSFLSSRGLATWRPHSAFTRALMSSCWQPIRSERSVMFFLWPTRKKPSSNLFCLVNYSFLFSFFLLFQDLSSPNQYDTGVALTGLSCFVTPDLARDLANDIMTLVSNGEYWEVYQQVLVLSTFLAPVSLVNSSSGL